MFRFLILEKKCLANSKDFRLNSDFVFKSADLDLKKIFYINFYILYI